MIRRDLMRALIAPAVVPFSTFARSRAFQTRAPEYRLALPGYRYSFPGDHGAHPEYKIEWWYFTGHLDADSGNRPRRFGYELTFFRIGTDRVADNPSAWNVQELHVAHFALSELPGESPGRFRFFERVNRRGPGIAFSGEGGLDVKNAGWWARMDSGETVLRAYASGILLELALQSAKPPVIHGVDGVSRKADAPGQSSHYYSMTRMPTTGIVSLGGQSEAISGASWMDHEFGTNQLAADQVGWDWFGLQLDNGEELMVYQLRRADGSIDPNSSGTVVRVDGTSRHLEIRDFSVAAQREWESPASGAIYALDWILRVPVLDSELRIRSLMDQQELVTLRSTGIAYWEGAVEVGGSWRGVSATGRGYVELTGYGAGYRPNV